MGYGTLMAALTVGRSNADVLEAARGLAERFDAKMVGLAVCRPIQAVCKEFVVPAPCLDEDRKQIKRQLTEAEAEFRAFLKSRADCIEWRPGTTLLPLSVHLAQEARGADLVIVPVDRRHLSFDATRDIDLADLVMQCPRPVLLVPTASRPTFDRILVAWKDTSEAQRAVADALPLLVKAQHVTVVEIVPPQRLADGRERLAQVVGWLKQHDISADARIETSRKGDASTQCHCRRAESRSDDRRRSWMSPR